MKYLKLSVMVVGVFAFFAGCSTPDIADGDIDLDTTYFPFGLGYEWCYERRDYHWDIWGLEWDKYDTVIFQVEDSIFDSLGWLFDLSGYYYDVGGDVRVLYQHPNTLLIPVFEGGYVDTISINPSSSRKIDIDYLADTLSMTYSYDDMVFLCEQSTKRMKEIGLIWQIKSEEAINGKELNHEAYTLLHFYNGQDTIYKAE